MKNFLQNLLGRFRAAFSFISMHKRNAAEISLKITKAILNMATSLPGEIVIESLIPDSARGRVEDYVKALAAAVKALTGLTDGDPSNDKQVVSEFIQKLSEMPELQRNALAQKLAGLVLAALDGDKDKLKEGEYQAIIDTLMHYTKFATK